MNDPPPTAFRPPRTAPRPPKTVQELRARFRLGGDAEAEALLAAWPVKEALRRYLNRCLATRRAVPAELPGWQEVDEYLTETALRLGIGVGVGVEAGVPRAASGEAASLERAVEDACFATPFALLPHAARFVLRVEGFLVSSEGRAFDAASGAYDRRSDVEFDRRRRAVDLLGFLVSRHKPNPR